MFGPEILIIVILVVAVIVVFAGVKTVPQGYNYTVERFGKYTGTINPGLNLIVPFFDTVGKKVNMMEQLLDVPSQEIITKDNATCTVDGVVFFQVLDARLASYEVANLELATLNLTMTNIRTVMGSMDLDELLSNRDEINTRLLHVIDAATQPWGVKVTRIEIKDINPPTDLVAAMARQMKAERDRRSSVLEAQGLREAAILRAEGEKQAQILEAEGRKEAAFRDAEAREREAQAEAEATRVLSEAISGGNVNAINYFVADKYVGALKEIAASRNQKILMLPLDATSLLGSIAGIGEIAKQAFSKDEGSDGGGGARATVPPIGRDG